MQNQAIGTYFQKNSNFDIGKNNEAFENVNEISHLHQRLKRECKGDLGLMNSSKLISFLNVIQKESCPEAYMPEIVNAQQRRRKGQDNKTLENEFDKTLFDFDEDVDKLNEVSDRYKPMPIIVNEVAEPKIEEMLH